MNDIIGIIVAMESELESLRNDVKDPVVETVSGIKYISGELCGKRVVMAQCGIGKVFAAICAQTMILKYAPSLLINTGVAGTLTAELSIGDIAVASDVVQHDMDTSPVGDPLGLISGINVIHFPADKKAAELLSAVASELGLNNVQGTIASGDQFIASAAQKEHIKSNFNAISCEMEGGAMGHVCYVNGVPFAVIRAISDSADDSSHMDYPTFTKMAAENSYRVMTAFLAKYE